MDTSKIEERLADLESKSCCGRVKFYSASSPKPTIGVKKVLYIHKWYERKGRREKDAFSLKISADAWQKREYYMGIAKSVVEMPEFHEWEAFYDHALYRTFPARNLNQRANSKTTDHYDLHGLTLKI